VRAKAEKAVWEKHMYEILLLFHKISLNPWVPYKFSSGKVNKYKCLNLYFKSPIKEFDDKNFYPFVHFFLI
jgi:hypothetical protein